LDPFPDLLIFNHPKPQPCIVGSEQKGTNLIENKKAFGTFLLRAHKTQYSRHRNNYLVLLQTEDIFSTQSQRSQDTSQDYDQSDHSKHRGKMVKIHGDQSKHL
jgi:hypothetical protein